MFTERLEGAKYWCGRLYNWKEMVDTDFFTSLNMLTDIRRDGQGKPLWTTKCPIRVNNQQLGGVPAPRLGADMDFLLLQKKSGSDRFLCRCRKW